MRDTVIVPLERAEQAADRLDYLVHRTRLLYLAHKHSPDAVIRPVGIVNQVANERRALVSFARRNSDCMVPLARALWRDFIVDPIGLMADDRAADALCEAARAAAGSIARLKSERDSAFPPQPDPNDQKAFKAWCAQCHVIYNQRMDALKSKGAVISPIGFWLFGRIPHYERKTVDSRARYFEHLYSEAVLQTHKVLFSLERLYLAVLRHETVMREALCMTASYEGYAAKDDSFPNSLVARAQVRYAPVIADSYDALQCALHQLQQEVALVSPDDLADARRSEIAEFLGEFSGGLSGRYGCSDRRELVHQVLEFKNATKWVKSHVDRIGGKLRASWPLVIQDGHIVHGARQLPPPATSTPEVVAHPFGQTAPSPHLTVTPTRVPNDRWERVFHKIEIAEKDRAKLVALIENLPDDVDVPDVLDGWRMVVRYLSGVQYAMEDALTAVPDYRKLQPSGLRVVLLMQILTTRLRIHHYQLQKHQMVLRAIAWWKDERRRERASRWIQRATETSHSHLTWAVEVTVAELVRTVPPGDSMMDRIVQKIRQIQRAIVDRYRGGSGVDKDPQRFLELMRSVADIDLTAEHIPQINRELASNVPPPPEAPVPVISSGKAPTAATAAVSQQVPQPKKPTDQTLAPKHPNGPDPIKHLWWWNDDPYELSERLWQLIKHVWDSPDRTTSFDELRRKYWPGTTTDAGIHNARNRADAVLARSGCGLTIRVRNKSVVITKGT